MKEWILSVSGMILLTTVFSLIIPSGKTASIMKTVFSVLCVFVFIKPVFYLYNQKNEISIDFSNNVEFNLNENYLNYILDLKKEESSKICNKILSQNGLVAKDLYINIAVKDEFDYNLDNITVYLDDSVIKDKNEHINNKEKARSSIAEYFGINQNSVVFYE